MNLEILIGAKAAQKIQNSGINILQACDIEIEYIAGKAAAKKNQSSKGAYKLRRRQNPNSQLK